MPDCVQLLKEMIYISVMSPTSLRYCWRYSSISQHFFNSLNVVRLDCEHVISDVLIHRSSRVYGRRVRRPRRRFIASSVAVRWRPATVPSSPSTLISSLYSRWVSRKLWNLCPASWICFRVYLSVHW